MDANLDKNVENTVEKPEKVSAEIKELRDRLSKIEKLLGIIARCELASLALKTKNEQLYSDDVDKTVSSLFKDVEECMSKLCPEETNNQRERQQK